MPTHPYIGRPTLEWRRNAFGVEAYIVRRAKYRGSSEYTTRELFMHIRKTDDGNIALPIFDDDEIGKTWLVLKDSFGTIKGFDTLKEAKLHVEATFTLEYID
jgi:hypothetical protein